VTTPNAVFTALVLDDQDHLDPTLGSLLKQEHLGLGKESMRARQFNFARNQLDIVLTGRWPAFILLISGQAPRISSVVHESDCIFVQMFRKEVDRCFVGSLEFRVTNETHLNKLQESVGVDVDAQLSAIDCQINNEKKIIHRQRALVHKQGIGSLVADIFYDLGRLELFSSLIGFLLIL